MRARAEIEANDGGKDCRAAAAEDDEVAAARVDGGKIAERKVDVEQLFRRKIDHGEASHALVAVSSDDAIPAGERVGRHAEDPLRLPELGLTGRHRIDRAARDVVAIQVPPAGAVGHEVERGAVGRPFGLKDRFRSAAGDRDRPSRHAARVDLAEVERGADPRHVRVIPREPRQPAAVGREPRRRDEIVTGREHGAGVHGAAVEAHRHDRVLDPLGLRARVRLADADPAPVPAVDGAVGVSPFGVGRSDWRQRDRHGGAAVQAVEPAVGPLTRFAAVVGEVEHAVRHRPRAAAVFVHACARAVGLGKDVLGAVGGRPSHDCVAVLLRALLQPIDVVAIDQRLRKADRLLGNAVRRDRRLPRPVGCRLRSVGCHAAPPSRLFHSISSIR